MSLPQPHETMVSELDIMANKFRDARAQNSNACLKNIASSALELYDNCKVSSLEELCRTSYEVAFAVLVSQCNASPNNEKGEQFSSEVQRKLVEVETIMADINDFAKIVVSRTFIASLFLHRWDAAKMQEYRSSLKKYITDKDFKPKVPLDIRESLRLQERRSNPAPGDGQTAKRQSFTPPPTRKLKKPAISTNPVNSTGPGAHFTPTSPLCKHSNASAPAIPTPTSAKVTSVHVWQYNYFGSVSETNLVQGSGNKVSHRNSRSFNAEHWYQEDVEFEQV